MSNSLKLNTSSPLRDQTVKPVHNNSNEYMGVHHSKRNNGDINGKNTPSSYHSHHQSLTAQTARLLHSTETVSQVIKRLMEFYQDSLLQPGQQQGANSSNALQQLLISPHQIGDCLIDQCANHTVFNGSFFDLLKKLLSQYKQHPHIQDSLANFLKHYDLFANKNSTFACLSYNLAHLNPYLSNEDQQAIGQLIQHSQGLLQSQGEVSNLAQLKELLLPILGRLASKNPENVQLRNQIMHAIHNLSRLDCSDQNSLLKSFDQLMDTLQQFTRISIQEQDALKAAMLKTINQGHDLETNPLNSFLAQIEEQLSKYQPLQTQGTAYQFLQSYLLNKNILLPILYCFMPLQFNDNYALAELWVDPDEQQRHQSAKGKTTKFFFTIDLPNIGYFQCYLEAKNQTIVLEIEGPESVIPLLTGMSNHLKSVTNKYGFQLSELTIRKLTYPKKFTEVFGHQILKEVSVNVIV